MRIWVTRAAPEAEATAQRLRALGHAPLVAPLLKMQSTGRAPNLEGACALAFTSRNGVRAFAALCQDRSLRTYTVGDATAAAARDVGFSDVHSAEGDVEALARLILQRRHELQGAVVHAGAHEPAGDLSGLLKGHGIEARLEPVYASEPAELPEAAAAALAAEPPEVDAVLVHSPRAARRLAELEAAFRASPHLGAYCLSEACAEALRPLNFASVAVAPFPNETSLLNLLSAAERRPLQERK